MNQLGNVIGEICKKILPIREEVYFGNQDSTVAICTLSSINLLRELKTSDVLSRVSVLGRLLTENKGIDSLIKNANNCKNLKKIILCGKEVSGHKAGHSLLLLHKNGIDSSRRIIDSHSPDPVLEVSKDQVEKFRNKVNLIDMIGETDSKNIIKLL